MKKIFFVMLPVYLNCLLTDIAHSADNIGLFCVNPLYDTDSFWKAEPCASVKRIKISTDERSSVSFILDFRDSVDDFSVSFNLEAPSSATQFDTDIRFLIPWYRADNAGYSVMRGKNKRSRIHELLVHDASIVKLDVHEEINFIKNADRYEAINQAGKGPGVFHNKIYDAEVANIGAVRAGDKHWIWVSINNDRNVAPGLYKGSVLLSSVKKNITFRVPIEIEVLPIQLSEPAIEYSIYYRSALTSGPSLSASDLRTKSQIEAELKNILSHGVSNPTIYEPITSVFSLDSILEIRRKVGISNRRIFLLGIATNYYNDELKVEKKIHLLKSLKNRLAKDGVEEIFVYGMDEAEPRVIKEQYPFWSMLRDQGIKIFAANWQKDSHKHLAEKVDLAVVGYPPSRELSNYYTIRDTKAYLYNYPQAGVVDPIVYRRNYGIGAWQLGYSGVMPFAYQYAMQSIWNDADHPAFRDLVFAYPVSNGVLDTIQWEGFSAGVDDVRYISTLINLADVTGDKTLKDNVEALRIEQNVSFFEVRQRMVRLILEACSRYQNMNLSWCVR